MAGQAFDDIRPYRDDEVAGVVHALADDAEFVAIAAGLAAPRWAQGLMVRAVAHSAFRAWLRRRARRLRSVADLQRLLSGYVERVLAATSDGMTVAGLDDLDPGGAYLFVSNHRDIALDPALLNYAISRRGHATSQIAIGDNLLGTGFRSHLMRLNKGFAVRRGVVGAKAQLQAMRCTSAYVRQTLEGGESVWIAQRAGRSKDGLDRTEPAILKMLQLAYRGEARPRNEARSRNEAHRLGDWLRRVRLTPVSISYEVDPCAPIKARELYFTARDGGYEKPPDEDIRSIEAGIAGFKGRVCLRFSQPVDGDFASVEELARHIDRCIVAGLAVYPTHRYAHARLDGADEPEHAMTPRVYRAFHGDLAACEAAHADHFLRQYANQIENRRALAAAQPG